MAHCGQAKILVTGWLLDGSKAIKSLSTCTAVGQARECAVAGPTQPVAAS
jgi:hypothetical protein